MSINCGSINFAKRQTSRLRKHSVPTESSKHGSFDSQSTTNPKDVFVSCSEAMDVSSNSTLADNANPTKRKKRRKSLDISVIKNKIVELCSKEMFNDLIRFKLKSNMVPIVLLERIKTGSCDLKPVEMKNNVEKEAVKSEKSVNKAVAETSNNKHKDLRPKEKKINQKGLKLEKDKEETSEVSKEKKDGKLDKGENKNKTKVETIVKNKESIVEKCIEHPKRVTSEVVEEVQLERRRNKIDTKDKSIQKTEKVILGKSNEQNFEVQSSIGKNKQAVKVDKNKIKNNIKVEEITKAKESRLKNNEELSKEISSELNEDKVETRSEKRKIKSVAKAEVIVENGKANIESDRRETNKTSSDVNKDKKETRLEKKKNSNEAKAKMVEEIIGRGNNETVEVSEQKKKTRSERRKMKNNTNNEATIKEKDLRLQNSHCQAKEVTSEISEEKKETQIEEGKTKAKANLNDEVKNINLEIHAKQRKEAIPEVTEEKMETRLEKKKNRPKSELIHQKEDSKSKNNQWVKHNLVETSKEKDGLRSEKRTNTNEVRIKVLKEHVRLESSKEKKNELAFEVVEEKKETRSERQKTKNDEKIEVFAPKKELKFENILLRRRKLAAKINKDKKEVTKLEKESNKSESKTKEIKDKEDLTESNSKPQKEEIVSEVIKENKETRLEQRKKKNIQTEVMIVEGKISRFNNCQQQVGKITLNLSEKKKDSTLEMKSTAIKTKSEAIAIELKLENSKRKKEMEVIENKKETRSERRKNKSHLKTNMVVEKSIPPENQPETNEVTPEVNEEKKEMSLEKKNNKAEMEIEIIVKKKELLESCKQQKKELKSEIVVEKKETRSERRKNISEAESVIEKEKVLSKHSQLETIDLIPGTSCETKESKLENKSNKIEAITKKRELKSEINKQQIKELALNITFEKTETRSERRKNNVETEIIIENEKLQDNQQQTKELSLKTCEKKNETLLEKKDNIAEIIKTKEALNLENTDKQQKNEVIVFEKKETRSEKRKNISSNKTETSTEKKNLNSDDDKKKANESLEKMNEVKLENRKKSAKADVNIEKELIRNNIQQNMIVIPDISEKNNEAKCLINNSNNEMTAKIFEETEKLKLNNSVEEKVVVLEVNKVENRRRLIRRKDKTNTKVLIALKEQAQESTCNLDKNKKMVEEENKTMSSKVKNKKESKVLVTEKKNNLRSEASEEQNKSDFNKKVDSDRSDVDPVEEQKEFRSESQDPKKEMSALNVAKQGTPKFNTKNDVQMEESNDQEKKLKTSNRKMNKEVLSKAPRKNNKESIFELIEEDNEVVLKKISSKGKAVNKESIVKASETHNKVEKIEENTEKVSEVRGEKDFITETSDKTIEDKESKEVPSKEKEQIVPNFTCLAGKFGTQILHEVVVKVDKKRTEHLVKEYCRTLQKHEKIEDIVVEEIELNATDSALRNDLVVKRTTENSLELTPDVSENYEKIVNFNGRTKSLQTTVDTVSDLINNSEDNLKSIVPTPSPLILVDEDNLSKSTNKFVNDNENIEHESSDKFSAKDLSSSLKSNLTKDVKLGSVISNCEKKLLISNNTQSTENFLSTLITENEKTNDKLQIRTEVIAMDVEITGTQSAEKFDKEIDCNSSDKFDETVTTLKKDVLKFNRKINEKVDKHSNRHVSNEVISIELKNNLEIADKNLEMSVQVKTKKRCTRNLIDRIHKSTEVASEKPSTTSSSSFQVVQKNCLNISSDNKVVNSTKKSLQLDAPQDDQKINESFNANKKVSKSFSKDESERKPAESNEKIAEVHISNTADENKEMKQVEFECKRTRKNNIIKSNNEIIDIENGVKNPLDVCDEQNQNEFKEIVNNLEKKVAKSHNLRNSKLRFETHPDSLTKSTLVSAEKSVEDADEKSDEKFCNNLIKNSDNLNKNQIIIECKKPRKSSEKQSESENVADNKLNEVPEKLVSSIREDFKEKVEITKRARRKSLSDKNDKQLVVITKSSSVENCSQEELQKLKTFEYKLNSAVVNNSKKVSFETPDNDDISLLERLNYLNKLDKPVKEKTKSNKLETSMEDTKNELPYESQKTANTIQTENNLLSDTEMTTTVTSSAEDTSEGVEQLAKESNDQLDKCHKTLSEKRKLLPERPNGSFLKKKLDAPQFSVIKNNERQPEIFQEIKECSKSQIENNKKVIRKSSSDDHDRLITKTDCLLNGTNEKEDKPVEEQKITEQNVKAPTEKRTYTKRWRNDCEGHQYQTRHSVDKKNEILAEESNQLLKDCVKLQNHVLKKYSKKMIDKNEKSSENAYPSLNSNQDEVVQTCKRLDNKENSKILLDNSKVIPRSVPLRKDKPSKNSTENHIESNPTVDQESTNPYNIIQEKKTIAENTEEIDANDTVEDSLSMSLGSIEEFSPEKIIADVENVARINHSTARQLDYNNDESKVKNSLQDFEKNDESKVKISLQDSEKNDESLGVEPLEKVLESNMTEYKNPIELQNFTDLSDSNENRIEMNIEKDRLCFTKIAQPLSQINDQVESKSEFVPVNYCTSTILDETINNNDLENLENEIKAYVIIKPGLKDLIQPLIIDNTKALDTIKSPIIDNRSEIAKESLKSFLRKKRITRHSQKNNGKPADDQNNANTKITAVDSTINQNLDGSVKDNASVINNLSKESVANAQSLTDNDIVVNDVSVQTFISDKYLCESLTKDTINNFKLSSSKRKGHARTSSPRKSKDISKACVSAESTTVKSKSTISSQGNLANNFELSKHRRQITLQELKKKCTENLENKKLTKTLRTVRTKDNVDSLEVDADDQDDDDDEEDSLVESDENLAARLARLNGLEIPPMDNLDSGVQSPSDDQQQRVVDKIVLRCPSGSSFIGLSAELQCKYCDETFITHRDLKKHTKVQHRQRLIIKITKTTSNERVTHMVEPLASPAENDEDDDDEDDDDDDDDEDEDDDDESPILFNGDNRQGQRRNANEHITEGEIKIIVKKQGDSKNSHVVKEIKITPRTPSDSGNSSCRLPSCSPAKSDLSGGSGSCRYPAYSPTKSDFGQVLVVLPKKRGRPRKYPIFTESELIAKQLAAASSSPIQVAVNEKIYSSFNSESLVAEPDVLFDNLQNIDAIKKNSKDAECGRVAPISMYNEHDKTDDVPLSQPTTDEPQAGAKRKRVWTISQSDQSSLPGVDKTKDPDEEIVQDEKRPKVCEEAIDETTSESMSSSVCEPEFLVKYDITKELVVKLTKIDTVPKPNIDSDANASESERTDVEAFSTSDVISQISRPKKCGPKSKTMFRELEISSQEFDPAKAVLTKNVSNDNRIVPSSPLRVQNNNALKTTVESLNDEVASFDDASTDSSQPAVSKETANKILKSIAEVCGDNDDSLPENNFEPVSEPEIINKVVERAIPRQTLLRSTNPIVSAISVSPTKFRSVAPPVSSTFQPQSLQTPPPLQSIHFHHQAQAQQQLQLLAPQQQFCILFIPDALYNPDTPMSKDLAPTATLVNFQPVPDSEIANKPLIFTPTTPTKANNHISTPNTPSSSEEYFRSFTCPTCTRVQDMIGRLEASHGMTEEDKSAIKCPYCVNHFQSLFYLEYHLKQEHLKCENEKQCRHGSSLRIPSHETTSESEIYITFALKCRSCYDIFTGVKPLNDHVALKHKTLVRFIKPSVNMPATPATVSSSAAVAKAAYPSLARRNGMRPSLLQSACPSDCVCRIGIRSTDSPSQREEMIRRCPSAMRRLEKIEPAAYEVYTCTLCNSTFLMKDEVVDHLMKMHEVSCKFPCYTCLTSFRTLQLQENHQCSETTFQGLDELFNIAILPTIGNTGDAVKNIGNKYLEDSSSMDEFNNSIKQEEPKNSLKRKNFNQIYELIKKNEVKKAKIQTSQKLPKALPKRKKHCIKCDKRFSYRKHLLKHVINVHILPSGTNEEIMKKTTELIEAWKHSKESPFNDPEFAEVLSHHEQREGHGPLSKKRGRQPKITNIEVYKPETSISMTESIPAPDNAELQTTDIRRPLPERCGRCNNVINQLNRFDRDNSSQESQSVKFCETCKNGGPSTRRRSQDLSEQQIKVKRTRRRKASNSQNPRYEVSDTTTTTTTTTTTNTTTSAAAVATITATQNDLKKQFSCRKCPESFVSQPELKEHKNNAHPKDEDVFTCQICDKTFSTLGSLESHAVFHNFFSQVNETGETAGSESNIVMRVGDISSEVEASGSFTNETNASSRRDSSDSCSGESKEPEQQLLSCTFCEEVYGSNVSLKNHLKREHGRRASICQFCNGLLIDTSEVRHMLDYHIIPSKGNRKAEDAGGIQYCAEPSNIQDDVEELVRVLGRHRLQPLMMYHDFEGKCNNAIMRCPICPELFATRESCRHHYVWNHDVNCLLCDENFRSGDIASGHKVSAHTSMASYFWCIQRLVTAIVNTLKLDPGQPSHVLYQMLVLKLEEQERQEAERQQLLNVSDNAGEQSGIANQEDAAGILEEVVLSEDQLPDAGNMIEVVIGREDSEDDLLSMLNLSPNYENNCEQRNMTKYSGEVMPGGDEETPERPPEALLSEQATSRSTPPPSPIANNTMPSTPTTGTTVAVVPLSPNKIENEASYVSSGVCKYKLDDESSEQLVLVVTEEDMVTYRDDIGTLAEKISATCDSLTLEEIAEMLRVYFENMNVTAAST